MPLKKRIADKLRQLRSLNALSQEEIAYKLQISQNAYWKIENGKTNLSVHQLITICSVYDICPSEFINDI